MRVAAVALFALLELGVIPNQQLGFECADPALSFEFSGDSVSSTTLLLATFVAPLPLMWAAEWTRARGWRGALREAALWHRDLAVGAGVVLLLTDVAKHVVGAPRPHFLDTCRPNCTGRTFVTAGLAVCTNAAPGAWRLRDAARSFPSGHAGLSVYVALFGVCFLRRRVAVWASSLLAPALQCACLAWAALCSLSRVTDRRHHWWDVLAGAVLGGGVAALTFRLACRRRQAADPKTDAAAHAHRSVRRLLSSTSSYNGSEERELKEAALT